MPNQSPSDRTLTLEPALEQQESSKVTIIKYSEDLLEEINDLLKKNELLDAVLVDASMTGFLFPSEVLLECSKLVPRLIDVGGANKEREREIREQTTPPRRSSRGP